MKMYQIEILIMNQWLRIAIMQPRRGNKYISYFFRWKFITLFISYAGFLNNDILCLQSLMSNVQHGKVNEKLICS